MSTPGYEEFFDEHTEAFEEETGIAVDVEFVGWGDARDTLLADITSQSGPDVQEIASTWIPEQVDAGGWADLNDETAAQNLPDTDNYPEDALSVGQFDDMLVGIPWFWGPRAWQEIGSQMDAAGVDGSPEDWDDLVSQGLAYSESSEVDGDFFGDDNSGFEPVTNFAMTLWQNGGSLLNEDNTEPRFHSQEGVEALNFYKDLIVEHEILTAETLEWGSSEVQGAFASGQIASTLGDLGTTTAYADEDGNSRDDLRVSALPTGPDGDTGTFFGMELLGITAWSDMTEEAAQWIEYLARPEVNAELADIAGFLPPTSEGMNTETFDDAIYETFSEEIFPTAQTYPQVLGWAEVESELNSSVANLLGDAISGNWSEGDTEVALQNAAEVAQDALSN